MSRSSTLQECDHAVTDLVADAPPEQKSLAALVCGVVFGKTATERSQCRHAGNRQGPQQAATDPALAGQSSPRCVTGTASAAGAGVGGASRPARTALGCQQYRDYHALCGHRDHVSLLCLAWSLYPLLWRSRRRGKARRRVGSR
jgi:hypothetical protein